MALSTANAAGGSRWNTKAFLLLGAAVLAVAASVVVVAKMTVLAPQSAAEASRRRPAIDAETNELFHVEIEDGATQPWENPKTHKRTLYPAEKCYWTKDGKAKLEPTYVLAKETMGEKGPTTCPDCGRPVVPHNPMPPTNLMIEAGKAGK